MTARQHAESAQDLLVKINNGVLAGTMPVLAMVEVEALTAIALALTEPKPEQVRVVRV